LPLKIDFHVHTCYSDDCSTSLRDIIVYSKRRGLDGVAITDHNTIEGALKLLKKENNEIIIIPGIEVSTSAGHILGINVTTSIPNGLTVEETVEKIHEAGGISIAAHPSAKYKSGIGLDEKKLSKGIDAVEVINSSVFPFFLNSLSRKLANRAKLPQTGGSDSHLPETIGLAYTIVAGVNVTSEVEEIVRAVKRGLSIPYGKPVPWKIRLRKILSR